MNVVTFTNPTKKINMSYSWLSLYVHVAVFNEFLVSTENKYILFVVIVSFIASVSPSVPEKVRCLLRK